MYELFRADTLFVVSDLHLGGTKQPLFKSAEAFRILADQIESAAVEAKQRPEAVVALVINGDFVDFLAEPDPDYFDPQGAIRKLGRILCGDDTFKPITEALRSLLRIPSVRVAVALGNHDLEIALPWVAAELVQLLTQGDPAAASRLHLVLDGTGVRVQVGPAQVLCLHGNEFDPDNVTDHERIRRIARDLSAGLPAEAFIPNAGTRLVIDAINPVKARYPFVDLLKPETSLALPALVALDPSLLVRVPDLGRLLQRRTADRLRMRFGFLNEEAGAADAPVATRIDVPDRGRTEADLVAATEDRFRGEVDPMDLVERQDMLGIWAAAGNLLRRRPAHEVLRELLERLDGDGSFDIGTMDEYFRAADEEVGAEIDFIVTGHTHLKRALRRRASRGFYYNTGTWAGLMRLDPAVRQDPKRFESFFKSLDSRTLDELEATGTVRREPVFARIRKEDDAVVGELQQFNPAAKAFSVVPHSTFKLG